MMNLDLIFDRYFSGGLLPNLEPRFHVVYHLYATDYNLLLRIRVPLMETLPYTYARRNLSNAIGKSVKSGSVWDPL